MNFLYVGMLLSGLAMIAVLFAMHAREEPRYRSYFRWGIAMILLGAVLPTAWALLYSRLGYQGARAPGNYHPFILFLNLFFLAPGMVAGLMGLWESRDYRRQQESVGAGPDRPSPPRARSRGRV